MDAEMHLGPVPMPGSHQINSAQIQPAPPAPDEQPAPPADRVGEVLAERGSRYGKFEDHAKVSGSLRSAVFGRLAERRVMLEPDQAEAVIMICHKLGRIANGDPDYADSWRDVAGYAELVARRLEGNPT